MARTNSCVTQYLTEDGLEVSPEDLQRINGPVPEEQDEDAEPVLDDEEDET
jgi:hypothetical protein